MSVTELGVGDPLRTRGRNAITATLMLGIVFFAVTWLAKEVPSFDLVQPWQDDPFDVITSLDYVILPGLVLAGVLRMQLCRRDQPLPARRLADLFRLCLVLLAVIAVTILSEWTATALGLHRDRWDAQTGWQLIALSAVSVSVIATAALIGKANRSFRATAIADAQPDWLADAAVLGLRWSGFLSRGGSRVRSVVLWVDAVIFGRVRSHPVVAAGVLSCALAVPFVASKVLLEGYPPLLVALSFALPACSLFAFSILLGRALRIVAPRSRPHSLWLDALVAGCVTGPLVFAFHDTLLTHPSQLEINALLFGGGLAGAAICLSAEFALRLLHRRRADL
jgi:hypothetical protein